MLGSVNADWSAARKHLLRLASLAEGISKHRPRAKKDDQWAQRADDLDSEGVMLWNASAAQKDVADDAHRAVCAAMRLAGFRLVEAGMENKPGIESVGDAALAAGVLSSAAKNGHAQARARAIVLYYSSRMEAAFREGNDGVADFMLEKISDQCAGNGARDAVKWIQRAFSIVEPLEDVPDTGDSQLRRSILRTLARAYFLSSSQDPENLARAEAALQELIDSVDSSVDHTSPEYQQLRWMRVAILKRRKAPRAALLEAFRSIIDHMQYSENTITDALVTAIHLHCLEQAFSSKNSASLVYLDRLLLSLIYHCSKDADHRQAMQDITAVLDLLELKEYELPRIPTTACLTLLWQFGDRHYHAKRWADAADWFLVGTHGVFGSMSHISNAKCLRKAALCYVQCGEHSQASAAIRRCPPTDAATHYVALLIAAHQGLEDEAVAAVHAMVHATNFNKKMLLLATRLANDSNMKTLLLSVLEALLDASIQEGVEAEAEAITLVRCIIRLIIRMMSEPWAHIAEFVPMLVRHFHTAVSLVTALATTNNSAVGMKDVSWLWRTAYNTAVQGCSEWENQEDGISDLFDTAKELLKMYMRSPAVDSEAELQKFLITASFAGTAGRIFSLRRRISNHAAIPENELQMAIEDITTCRSSIRDLLVGANELEEDDLKCAQSFLSILSVFGVEIACRLKMWPRIIEIIEDTNRIRNMELGTFEAMTDILAILHASLDRAVLSIEKFSRWLRAICTILLSRSAPADRTRAIGYVEQAVGVLQEHHAESDPHVAPYLTSSGMSHSLTLTWQRYPSDERQWLLATAYNTGIECLHASLLDEAKRWFEAATAICRFVPDGESRSDKISRTYTQLLERYSR
ncbi:hypothetical protein BN946_scf184829.g69 [Trametes cinnabarina]|uniref:Protein ZIP4 homolog n=1 Tax=Pycnoporus cinnabarinus TaxID=5643 RepID=A0A060S9D0_PYCCI|nr:hypothetical protein BN946_scf184829.g69 [Trametes cinnabarina]